MNNEVGSEARQLAMEMEKVRDGKISRKNIKEYLVNLEVERQYLIEELEKWCSYLKRNMHIPKIPVLAIDEAKKREYLAGYAVQDFRLCKMLEIFQNNPTIPPLDTDHASLFIMLLQAVINDLSWAIGELNAHLTK